VNSRSWEYWPSMSDGRLLFGRRTGSTRKILLYDLRSRNMRTLDVTRSSESFAAPGQVNGNYAVWYRCSSGKDCDVFRYHLTTRNKVRIPGATSFDRAPSVTSDGTVYYARAAGKACARKVSLMRWDRKGGLSKIDGVPLGQHIGDTYVDEDKFGNVRTYFDRFVCGRASASDIYMHSAPNLVRLTATADDPNGGSVTADPDGRDCGPGCHEYAAGRRVTLTAAENEGYRFAGWTGACEGSTSSSCSFRMRGDRNATALFEPSAFTLTVSPPEGGKVQSADGAIDCGTDCSAGYDPGTEVTLDAIPNFPGWQFAGWTGACAGNETQLCTLTMNQDLTVGATFEPILEVDIAGERAEKGHVHVSPEDVDCVAGEQCRFPVELGVSVVLTAIFDDEATKAEWEGCEPAGDVCTLTMDGPRHVTATFRQKNDA
jgi:uncharacterized repeat protein (TIGR02543 family)